jgi:hypothetical protein
MPTPGAGITSFAIVYETNANDKIRIYGTTLFKGFSIQFELAASDRRYLETTSIKGFGVEFEYSLLYTEEVYKK